MTHRRFVPRTVTSALRSIGQAAGNARVRGGALITALSASFVVLSLLAAPTVTRLAADRIAPETVLALPSHEMDVFVGRIPADDVRHCWECGPPSGTCHSFGPLAAELGCDGTQPHGTNGCVPTLASGDTVRSGSLGLFGTYYAGSIIERRNVDFEIASPLDLTPGRAYGWPCFDCHSFNCCHAEDDCQAPCESLHDPCDPSEENDREIAALEAAILSRDAARLHSVTHANESIFLPNWQRQAVQVVNCKGMIVGHYYLDSELMGRFLTLSQ